MVSVNSPAHHWHGNDMEDKGLATGEGTVGQKQIRFHQRRNVSLTAGAWLHRTHWSQSGCAVSGPTTPLDVTMSRQSPWLQLQALQEGIAKSAETTRRDCDGGETAVFVTETGTVTPFVSILSANLQYSFTT
ncbi:hypothetical protein AAFF_G00333050 [Aldrovandia affinis]|uniref:Uncharacterized protein n=1 Tax=Aldrovandia affinis TaxID=143900 RepID=A0AAD7SLX3_9TELE|nr:hypothetical protein AAFF_G00333050 [Aldrovandia affinis]